MEKENIKCFKLKNMNTPEHVPTFPFFMMWAAFRMFYIK